MQAKTYQVSPNFARGKGWPNSFTATELKCTEKAVYVYGHGDLDPRSRCMMCGRNLTHPGSILIGIGPDCLNNWDRREEVKDNITQADIDRLKAKIRSMKINGWMPKAVVKEIYDSSEQIEVPEDHPMINGKPKTDDAPKRAIKVQFKESGKDGIKITFPKDGEFRENLTQVKTLPGRRFHKQANPPFWTCPLSIEAIESLQEWGFELDQELIDYINTGTIDIDKDLPGEIQIPDLKGELMLFQRKCIEFLEHTQGRALVGDEMGLGKTIETIAYLQLHPEKRPAIIVCPASLKLNWLKEINEWMPEPNVQLLSGQPKKAPPIIGDILVINYDILRNTYKKQYNKVKNKNEKVEVSWTGWVDYLKQINPAVVVIDECHSIKDNQSNQTKSTKKLVKGVPEVIPLSGTFIVNRPYEGYNALRMVDPEGKYVPSFWKYVQRYCSATHNGFGWDFTGADNTEELHQKLMGTVMIRRKKEDVLKDLPVKIPSTIPFEINNEKEYKQVVNDFINYVKKTKGEKAAKKASNAEALTKVEQLKQIAVKGKMKQAKEWIRNFVESDGKLVIFATHRSTIDELMKEFFDITVRYDGTMNQEQRNNAVESFQNDPNIRLFIGMYDNRGRPAGTGLTLTAASSVAIIELQWAPGVHDQAEDRCHRIGQKDSVNAYYLIASKTIEEKIAALIDEKRRTLDQVLDGKETEEESLLTELIKQYQES